MQRSQTPPLSKSPSRRGIYVNEQTNKREVATIFHSPYKDGRPNRDYLNPSFVSSHLFYPKEHLQAPKDFVVRKNYIPNPNDIRKEALYQQRIRTESDLHAKSKTKDREFQKKAKEQRKPSEVQPRILRLNDPEKLLKNELSNLQNYRENNETTQTKQRTSTARFEDRTPETPIYLQKNHRDLQYELAQQASRRRDISDWNKTAIKKDPSKSQLDENAEYQRRKEEYQRARMEMQMQQRRQGQLLGTVLREQMRVNLQKRERGWQQ